MERLRTAHERAERIVEAGRLQAFLDSLNHDEYEMARPYIDQPPDLMMVKIALRLEQHIFATEAGIATLADHLASEHGSGLSWRAIGAMVGATLAGAAATATAIRESMK